MRVFLRLASIAAFLGVTVLIPGALLGRVLTGRRDRISVVLGIGGVLLTAVVPALLFKVRLGKATLALAGLAVGLTSLALLRRRER